MKASTLLPFLLGSASVHAGVAQLKPRQNGEAKDMNQWADWAVIAGWCPVYISMNQPAWDRSLDICTRYCKEHSDGQYASVSSEHQPLVEFLLTES